MKKQLDWGQLQVDHTATSPGPERPLAQYYDLIEVCGGSSVLSDEMNRRGFVVGPIIDLTYSEQCNLVNLQVLEWLIFLVQNRRVKALALERPCTTFSPAAFPSVRSYTQPRGYNQKSRKVWLENRLAVVCFWCLWQRLL